MNLIFEAIRNVIKRLHVDLNLVAQVKQERKELQRRRESRRAANEAIEQVKHYQNSCTHAHYQGETCLVLADVGVPVIICQHCQKVVKQEDPEWETFLARCSPTGWFGPSSWRPSTEEQAAIDAAYSLPMKELKKRANAQLRRKKR